MKEQAREPNQARIKTSNIIQDTINEPHEVFDDEINTGTFTKEDLWEQIGFHKPLAGFWYNTLFNIINLLIGFILSGIYLSFFMPFPESKGYQGIAGGIFGIFVTVFNLGTANCVNRFIAEARIKDINLMIKYIQYFIWYQMITGLIQLTAFSIYALFFATETDIAYAVWILLIYSCFEYPGMLSIFHSILGSLQHYHRQAIVGFISSQIIERITGWLFLWLGKIYGQNHPEIGVIMGVAFGGMIGMYVDNFFGMLLGAIFFNKGLKAEGITAKMCFRVDFSWKDIKPVFIFGLKTGLPGVYSSFVGWYIFQLLLRNVPQYTTFSSLVGNLGPLLWIISTSNPAVQPLYTEAYMNGKKNLTRFYIAESWRFTAILVGFFMCIFVPVISVFPDAFVALDLLNYLPLIPFIYPYIFKMIIDMFVDEIGQIIYGANRANYMMITNFLSNTLNLVFFIIMLEKFDVQSSSAGMIFLMIWAGSIVGYLFVIIGIIYVQKTILKLEINKWPTFVAPAFSLMMALGLNYLVKKWIYEPILYEKGFLIAIIPTIISIFITAMYIYFPLTTIFGGWDEGNMKDFSKCVAMSGPSKFIVAPIFVLIKKIGIKSPLHDKFKYDRSVAEIEAQELMEMKLKGEILLN